MGSEEHQKYVMDRVFAHYSKHDSIILERTPLDVYSYTKLMEVEAEYARQQMKVEAFFRGLLNLGRPIFYFPIYFDLENDGVRPGQEDQVQIDRFIHSYLDDNGVNYYTVPFDTPEARADFILERTGADARI